MKTLLLLFRGWLLLCFALTFFVVPIYLISIYPEVPEPYYQMMRGLGYGVVRGPASELGYWYRLLGCGAVVTLGVLMASMWLRDAAWNGQDHGRPPQKGKASR
ncbi:hypothetical protein [Piscinibacter sp. XHJ-5]|uniref:hypothetical protein n=1 Tax=Piscinibacter sp. XHJ-5 TaxID=3037797 RepID=UPI00245334B4|nr:hypothetical protein [Piscinibacter sp. XHJ-5]